MVQEEKGKPLPKFGEWDVNDPTSAEGFTMIFNKARDERKTGGSAHGYETPRREDQPYRAELAPSKPAVSPVKIHLHLVYHPRHAV